MGLGGMQGNGAGGPMGALGMDMAPYKMPIIGGFFQDPNELHQKEQMHRAANAFQAYRPEVSQAIMNNLSNSLASYQGANNALASMYGPMGAMGNPQALRNPMGPSMMQQGAPNPVMGQGPQVGDMFGMGGMDPMSMLGGMGGGLPGMGGGMPGMGGGFPF